MSGETFNKILRNCQNISPSLLELIQVTLDTRVDINKFIETKILFIDNTPTSLQKSLFIAKVFSNRF